MAASHFRSRFPRICWHAGFVIGQIDLKAIIRATICIFIEAIIIILYFFVLGIDQKYIVVIFDKCLLMFIKCCAFIVRVRLTRGYVSLLG